MAFVSSRCALSLFPKTSFAVFIVPSPPDVGISLGPSLRTFFPTFLSSPGSQIQLCPGRPQQFYTPLGSEVRPKDPCPIPYEHTQPGYLALIHRNAEIPVEAAAMRRIPWHRPSHMLFVFFNLRDHDKRCIACIQVGQISHMACKK